MHVHLEKMKIIVLHNFKFKKSKKHSVGISLFGRIRRGRVRATVLLFVISVLIFVGIIGFTLWSVINDKTQHDNRGVNYMSSIGEDHRKRNKWRDVFECRVNAHGASMVSERLVTEIRRISLQWLLSYQICNI